jgi:hypothetical protein
MNDLDVLKTLLADPAAVRALRVALNPIHVRPPVGAFHWAALKESAVPVEDFRALCLEYNSQVWCESYGRAYPKRAKDSTVVMCQAFHITLVAVKPDGGCFSLEEMLQALPENPHRVVMENSTVLWLRTSGLVVHGSPV